ncbi:LADA_0G00364g1_1 [Lachancea dasiensis]|uniref:LADA_0G00364g1_1 n=1 Tax=Lachancea dasiensis TaxID=1072105 RepID=A0A1G4JQ51_9SACH|nr:LADA_0G00364g1_1 [Lachancea dasiensis]
MSIDQDLDSIIGENKTSKRITKYRRRDLRNGLASRIGGGIGHEREFSRRDLEPGSYSKSDSLYNDVGTQPRAAPKKRLRITQIPLQVSDFVIEDLVKKIANPVYANFYDHPGSRTGVFEFEKPSQMEDVAKAFTDREVDGSKLSAEIYELKSRQNRRGQSMRGQSGSRRRERGGRKDKEERRQNERPTADQLDQELADYMRD